MKKKDANTGREGSSSIDDFKALDSSIWKDDKNAGEGTKGKLQELERSYSIIQTLLNVSASINSTLNLQELLKRIVDAVVRITDCRRGFLMLGEAGGNFTFAIARTSDQKELGEEAFEISKSIVSRVANTGTPIFLPNVQDSNNFKNQASIIDLNIHTAICIPLKFEGKVIGIIYADSDHISKSFSESDLSIMNAFGAQAAVAIENAKRHGELELSKKTLEKQNISLKRKLAEIYEFSGMVGHSEAMRSIFEVVKKVAPLSTTVLIQGETGTGKELIAKAIHHNSPRKHKAMLSINCGAMPKELLESELFGYRKGAFTGADQDRMGIFEAASGGTIFLDEIGEMEMELQVKLLRTLQEGEVRRLGEENARPVDVRVISATNKNLLVEVEKGNFRKDLYYRLNVVPIFVPPLRERQEDILPLAEFFLERYANTMGIPKPMLAREAKELLLVHPWNGNVRELEHTMERVLALGEGRDVIEVAQFEYLIKRSAALDTADGDTSLKTMLLFWERDFIRKMLVRNAWNVSKTASALRISRQQLHNKIKKFGLKPEV